MTSSTRSRRRNRRRSSPSSVSGVAVIDLPDDLYLDLAPHERVHRAHEPHVPRGGRHLPARGLVLGLGDPAVTVGAPLVPSIPARQAVLDILLIDLEVVLAGENPVRLHDVLTDVLELAAALQLVMPLGNLRLLDQ